MTTQQELIRAYLTTHAPTWVPGYALNRVQVGDQWLSHNASRRARELAQAGAIERCIIDGEVHYRVALPAPVLVDTDGTPYVQPALPGIDAAAVAS